MDETFVGREVELGLLRKRLDRVAASGRGTAVAMRGRRQVGKSRLVQEFCDQSGVPYFFYSATKGASPLEATSDFLAELKDSSLPVERDLVPPGDGGSWPAAFRVLASILPSSPAIVVLDEVPWLSEQAGIFDGALQTAWDRLLATKPVLLLLLGSDIHMMERLTAYDRPFYGRADNFRLGPLNLGETAKVTGLTGADAIDAQLITGGLPGVLQSWPAGKSPLEFLKTECNDSYAPLFSVPAAVLMSEFPAPDMASRVLEAVGSGDRTQANIAATAGSRQGGLPSGSLSPLLRRMTDEKRIIAIDEPLSTRGGKPSLYRVSDSNLRFHLAMGRSAHELVMRGRPSTAYRLIERRWTSWRGRAVEPLIREALEIAAASEDLPWPDATEVGGWWNRQFDPEVDLVGADRTPVAKNVFFVGSVKWLGTPFGNRDWAELMRGAAQVPGFVHGESGTVIVSLSGIADSMDPRQATVVWGPDDVVDAWTSER